MVSDAVVRQIERFKSRQLFKVRKSEVGNVIVTHKRKSGAADYRNRPYFHHQCRNHQTTIG